MIATSLVLVLACANLSHLFLVRTEERQHEVRTSFALGATRPAVVRTVLLEAIALGLCGALVALLIALVSFGALQHQVPLSLSGGARVGLDWRVAIWALALGVASALICSARPLSNLAAAKIQDGFVSQRSPSARRPPPLRSGSMMLQVAVTLVCLSTAIAATRHFVSVLQEPLGFAPQNVLTVHALPSGPVESVHAFYLNAVQTLRGRPGVISAGAIEALPLSGATVSDSISTTRADGIPLLRALPGYFEAAGIRLLEGRAFDWHDHAASSTAVLSSSAATILFPDLKVAPVGQRITSPSGDPLTVIGIVADVKMTAGRRHDPVAYTVADRRFTGRLELLVRMRDALPGRADEVRHSVAGLEPEMVVTTRWWSTSINSTSEYRTPRFHATVLIAVATLAVGLTALGVFGVASYSWKSRRHELAIRVALGAQPASITRMLALQIMRPVSIGLVGGLFGTWLAGPFLAAYLVGFTVWDWSVIGSGTAIVVSTAVLSVYLPARRASRLPPMTVLHTE